MRLTDEMKRMIDICGFVMSPRLHPMANRIYLRKER